MPPPAPSLHSGRVWLKGDHSTLMTVTAVAAVGVMLLGTAIGVGLRWPDAWWRRGPADATGLDYSTSSTRLERLRAAYIRALLGGDPLAAIAPSEAQPASGQLRNARANEVEVAHAFTNDDVEDAYDIPSVPFRATTDTTGATRQASDPSDCSPVGGTAWYRYRPTGELGLFADTFGSAGPTALAVYTGEQPDALAFVGCDINALGNAQVGFRPTSGATYWFQVTAPGGGGPTIFELAAVGPTTLESLSPSGGPADAGSFDHPDISADGRYIAFASYARNLAPNPPPCPDAGLCETLYLRDRVTGTTTALATQSNPANEESWSGVPFLPSVSADGRYVSYSALSFPVVGHDGPPEAQPTGNSTYLYDRVTGLTELVSRNSAGEPAQSDPAVNFGYLGAFPTGSAASSVSADGRYVVFNSDAKNLGGQVERGERNTYRRDRLTGTTTLVSTNPSGEPNHADNCAGTGRNISHDGRYVSFLSTYGTGTEGSGRIYFNYLWDATSGRSQLVSKRPQVTAGNYCAGGIALDGSRVGFVTTEALVPEDTNGTPDVYVYDVTSGNVRRVSVTSAGEQTADPNVEGEKIGPFARGVTLSADGRFAVFDSAAPGLAPGAVGSTGNASAGPPGPRQVYLHDLVTGATTLVSVSSTGEPLSGESILPYISPGASAVTFLHADSSGRLDVVVHELR